ncbi:MAG: AfsA-related hotdog domain-containing protein [Desulfobacteraceae bacterium]|jgi:hypothetical protein
MEEVFYVFGDKFKNYENIKNCITISALMEKLSSNEFESSITGGVQYLPGQGLQEDQIKLFLKKMEDMCLSKYFDAWYSFPSYRRAQKVITHKHCIKNILITDPIKLDDDTYEMDLIIDDRNEIMSDHVTGYHLQGMLLVEAARQAFLAVTEKFFMGKAFNFQTYFIIRKMLANFYSFVFPIEAKLIYRILKKDISDPLKLNFSVSVEINQMEKSASCIDISFSVFHKPWLETKEKNKSEKCINYNIIKHFEDKQDKQLLVASE